MGIGRHPFAGACPASRLGGASRRSQAGAKRSLSPSLRSTDRNYSVDAPVPATTRATVTTVDSNRNSAVGSVTIRTARATVSSRKMPADSQVGGDRQADGLGQAPARCQQQLQRPGKFQVPGPGPRARTIVTCSNRICGHRCRLAQEGRCSEATPGLAHGLDRSATRFRLPEQVFAHYTPAPKDPQEGTTELAPERLCAKAGKAYSKCKAPDPGKRARVIQRSHRQGPGFSFLPLAPYQRCASARAGSSPIALSTA